MPRAWPRGLDFFQALILWGEACVLIALTSYVAPDYGRLGEDAVAAVLFLAGLVGSGWILARQTPAAYAGSAFLVCALPLYAFPLFMAHQLLDPLGGRNFVGALFGVLAIILAAPAGVRGRRQAQQQGHTPTPRGWRSRHGVFAIACAGLVLGASYAGLVASIAAEVPLAGSADFTADEVGAKTVQLDMTDFQFEPREFELTAGRLTMLVVRNLDDELHTFTYMKNGTEYSHNVFPEANATVWLFFPEIGSVPYRCLPHSDDYDDAQDMVGVIHVVPDPTR